MPFIQCSSESREKKTNSGVVHTSIEPSALTSIEVTGPGMPSRTIDAFSLCMIASYSATPPSVRPRTRLPARVCAWQVKVYDLYLRDESALITNSSTFSPARASWLSAKTVLPPSPNPKRPSSAVGRYCSNFIIGVIESTERFQFFCCRRRLSSDMVAPVSVSITMTFCALFAVVSSICSH